MDQYQMRKSINGEKYSTENEALADMATSLGWVVDDSKLNHQGLRFSKGKTHIWKCVNSRVSLDGDKPKPTSAFIWQVADLIDNHFCNHRPYHEDDLKKALKEN